jgi:hypothetical protein
MYDHLPKPKHVPRQGFLTDKPVKRLAPKSAALKQIERRQKTEALRAPKKVEPEKPVEINFTEEEALFQRRLRLVR